MNQDLSTLSQRPLITEISSVFFLKCSLKSKLLTVTERVVWRDTGGSWDQDLVVIKKGRGCRPVNLHNRTADAITAAVWFVLDNIVFIKRTVKDLS